MGDKIGKPVDHARSELGEFTPGMFVNVMYTSPTDGSRLKINFLNGDDNLLCVNPRYDECSLVLNSKLGGGWQHEECPNDFPLDKGKDVELMISAEENSFELYSEKFNYFSYSYLYRDEVTNVKCIQCEGNGTNLLAFVGKVLPDFDVGKAVYIHGRAPTEDGFNIDLVPSLPSHYKSDIVCLHIGVRFAQGVVIRNNNTKGKWGNEEKWNGMPFRPGSPFAVIIYAQKGGFEISVNGKHFTKFNYRSSTPLQSDMCVQLVRVPHIEKIEFIEHELLIFDGLKIVLYCVLYCIL
uniref:Galectin n=1 Tax=Suberites domuncula TaxID=55567 RepID=Q1MSI8_SUBDO|nr:galectin 2 [Suberites domuncula]